MPGLRLCPEQEVERATVKQESPALGEPLEEKDQERSKGQKWLSRSHKTDGMGHQSEMHSRARAGFRTKT